MHVCPAVIYQPRREQKEKEQANLSGPNTKYFCRSNPSCGIRRKSLTASEAKFCPTEKRDFVKFYHCDYTTATTQASLVTEPIQAASCVTVVEIPFRIPRLPALCATVRFLSPHFHRGVPESSVQIAFLPPPGTFAAPAKIRTPILRLAGGIKWAYCALFHPISKL